MRNTRLIRHSLRTAMGLSLTACLSLISLNASAAGEESPADLLGFQRTGNTLEFTVISTGCTTEDHFRLDVTTTENNATASDEKQPAVILTPRKNQSRQMQTYAGPQSHISRHSR